MTCKCTPNGSFTASPENAPKDSDEAKVTGPVYAWTISPTNYVSFTPTNAPTVDLSLLNTNAFGKTYGVSVVVTWFESNTVTHTVTPIPATTNMTLVAIKVVMIGASSNETWPCTCPASDVIFAANVLPSPPLVDLLWSASCNVGGTVTIIPLQCVKSPPPGTPTGLSGADFFAVFKPSGFPTANYSITARLNMELACSVSTGLLVRAVPTGKVSSESDWLSSIGDIPYGRVYKHTFSSSGGSLEGVKISEDIKFGDDIFKFGWKDFTYGDSIWLLDSNGKMEDGDMYQDPYNIGRININCFHPSPPGAGTPADFSTKQTYAWQCPLCEKYQSSFTHYIHTGLSLFVNITEIPKYYTCITSDLVQYEEDYLGTPYLNFGNFVVSPATTIKANGTNTFQIGWSGSWSKSDNPLAKDLIWNWDWEDQKGCKMDSFTSNPVTVTVGKETGTLTMFLLIYPTGDKDPTFKLHSVNVQLVAP